MKGEEERDVKERVYLNAMPSTLQQWCQHRKYKPVVQYTCKNLTSMGVEFNGYVH